MAKLEKKDIPFKEWYHPSNCKISIFYVESVEKTFNLKVIWDQIDQLWKDNLKRNGNIFDGLNIEIYDKDIQADLQILCFGGLTYTPDYFPNTRLIRLNTNSILTEKDCANCFSHELGHYKAFLRGFNNKNLEFTKKYLEMRLQYQTKNTPIVEMIAEDDRLLEGCSGAKGFERTDVDNYIQATKISGLSDLLFMWKAGQEFVTNNFNKLPENMLWKKSSLNWELINDRLTLKFSFKCVIPIFSINYVINRFGIYRNNICIQSFV